MMLEKFHDEVEIAQRVQEVGRRITKAYGGEELLLVGILKGSFGLFLGVVEGRRGVHARGVDDALRLAHGLHGGLKLVGQGCAHLGDLHGDVVLVQTPGKTEEASWAIHSHFLQLLEHAQNVHYYPLRPAASILTRGGRAHQDKFPNAGNLAG